MADNLASERFIRQVDDILWSEWDPIGCGVPRDEYSSYATVVANMAVLGESADQIIDYLHWAESEHMGLSSSRNDVRVRTATLVARIRAMATEQFGTRP